MAKRTSDVTVVWDAMTVKASRLSKEKGDIMKADLCNGSQLLLLDKGDHYSAIVIPDTAGRKERRKVVKRMARIQDSDYEVEPKKLCSRESDVESMFSDDQDERDEERQRKEEQQQRDEERQWQQQRDKERKRIEEQQQRDEERKRKEQQQRDKENVHYLQLTSTESSDEDTTQLQMIMKRLDTIERILRRLEARALPSQSHALMDDPQHTYNGVNLLTIVAKDATAYGRKILDLMFTKADQRESLVYKAHEHKSQKSVLDKTKVGLLLECVKLKFPEHNQQKLLNSLNQKCRDAKKHTDC